MRMRNRASETSLPDIAMAARIVVAGSAEGVSVMGQWRTVGAFVVGVATIVGATATVWALVAVEDPPAGPERGETLRDSEDGTAGISQPAEPPPVVDSTTTSSSATSTIPSSDAVLPPTSATAASLEVVTTPSLSLIAPTQPPPPTTFVTTTAAVSSASEPMLLARVSAGEAAALINNYLLAAGDQRYQEAFAMLSSAVQLDQDGYDGFVRFWSSIEVAGGHPNDVEVAVIDDQPGRLTVDTMLFFDPIGQSRSVELVRIVVIRSRNNLVIDYYDADRQ